MARKTTGWEAAARSEPIPAIIPKDAWGDFVDARKAIGAPITHRARELLFAKLERFHAQGQDVRAVLEQSVELGWRGVFPVKGATPHAAAETPQRSLMDGAL